MEGCVRGGKKKTLRASAYDWARESVRETVLARARATERAKTSEGNRRDGDGRAKGGVGTDFAAAGQVAR